MNGPGAPSTIIEVPELTGMPDAYQQLRALGLSGFAPLQLVSTVEEQGRPERVEREQSVLIAPALVWFWLGEGLIHRFNPRCESAVEALRNGIASRRRFALASDDWIRFHWPDGSGPSCATCERSARSLRDLTGASEADLE
jgi:hypothetical protein